MRRNLAAAQNLGLEDLRIGRVNGKLLYKCQHRPKTKLLIIVLLHRSLPSFLLLFSRPSFFFCLAFVLLFLLLVALFNWRNKILFPLLLLLVFLFASFLFSLFSRGAFFALLGEEIFAGLDLEVDFGFFGGGREGLWGCLVFGKD